MDPHVILSRGRDASALLETPAFNRVVDDLTNMHLSALGACRPGLLDAEARDYHHALYHGLCEIVSNLHGYVAAAAEMEARFEEAEADAADNPSPVTAEDI